MYSMQGERKVDWGKCDVRGYQPTHTISWLQVYFGSTYQGVGISEMGNLHVVF